MSSPRFKVFSSPRHIAITSSHGNASLLIDQESGASSFAPTHDPASVFVTSAHVIVGLTPDRRSLILGTESSLVSSHSPLIQRVKAFLVMDLRSSRATPLEEAGLKKDLLFAALKTPYFYFSLEADLSRHRLPPISPEKGFIQRYVWNASHLETLFQSLEGTNDREASLPFQVPLIHGAVFTFKTPVNKKNLKWILISRRSNQRVGTRFFARGIDARGNVANHVETEQIIRIENEVESSFLQTRGSIPIFWHQTPDIRYMPQPWPCPSLELGNAPAVQHFEEQMKLYGGSITCINLVNQKKGEGRMEQAFDKVVKEIQNEGIHYVAFDFHAECKKANGGWAQLYKLIRLLQSDIEKYGYYLDEQGKVTEQKGVFRTNCMDCLDRTNVVQSLLATEHINNVLRKTSVLSHTDSILNYPAFQKLYKNAWADHANLISIQYSGTGALKTDFTRTGVRTRWGLLQDGWNSATRYVFNNFRDGFRTDALNYFVGSLPLSSIVAKNKRDRETQKRSLLGSFPSILKGFIYLFVFLLVFLSPQDSKPLVSLMTLILTLLVWIFKLNGPAFVNYPTDYDIRASPPLQPGCSKKFS